MGALIKTSLTQTIKEARACTLCEAHLPLGPNPVFQASARSKILIAGQAPGTKVHASGIPFDDPSGDRLRDWLGISAATFYDPKQIALLPMGFCYPGRGKSGDLPPRPECADAWRERFLASLNKLELTLAIGQYAQAWHLGADRKKTLTETVREWRSYTPNLPPNIVPLPHPSPRNNIWLKKNPWFEKELIPELRKLVRNALDADNSKSAKKSR